ncbi:hypothetical protein M433DRAFT_158496 [Acidomyces richmondensis BFW]|nr:MAG: hypothetical protein FE78DRAFT_85876 [Acidomyces sp. 'richmondensis']KYG41940.1 hypothetical protein M433DRAFT_158496 [Acidomyces richmondensis BFW]
MDPYSSTQTSKIPLPPFYLHLSVHRLKTPPQFLPIQQNASNHPPSLINPPPQKVVGLP